MSKYTTTTLYFNKIFILHYYIKSKKKIIKQLKLNNLALKKEKLNTTLITIHDVQMMYNRNSK